MAKLTLKRFQDADISAKKENTEISSAEKDTEGMARVKPSIKPVSQWKEIKTKGLDSIIIGSLFLIFLLCPLFFTGLVAQGMGFEKIILFYFLVLLGTVAWVTKAVVRGELKLIRTPLDLPIIAILVFSIASTIMSINSKVSLIGSYGNPAKGLVAVIVFILFYYLLLNNINTKRIKLLFWTLVSSFSLIIIYALLQLLGVFLLPVDFTRVFSFNPIGSLLSLSMFLVIIIPIQVLALTQLKEINPKLKKSRAIIIKAVLGIITLAGLLILAFLNSMTFWPAAIAGMIIVLLFLLSKFVFITNNNLIIPITAFFLLIIFLVLGNFNILNKELPTEISLSRSTSWNIAKESIKENPVFGSGLSTFYYSFSKFKGIDFNSSPFWNIRFDNSSGYFFEVIANVGIIGAIALFIAIIFTLLTLLKTIIKTKADDIKSILLSLFSSSIIIIILLSIFPFNNSLVLISIFIFSLGIAIALNIQPEKLKEINLSFHISPKYNLILAIIFLAVSAGVIAMFTLGIKIYLADFYANKSLVVESLDEKINKLNKSIQLTPYQDIYYINLANNYMAVVNQEASGDGDQNIILTNLNQAIKNARTAVEIAPEKAANNEFLALIYENASVYTRGGVIVWAKSLEESYNKVIELEPDNPTPYFRIALINVARANVESDDEEKNKLFNQAIEDYSKAIEKKNDLSAAYYGKGIAYEKQGNINEAIEQLKTAVNTTTNNIDYAFELGRLYFNRGISEADTSEPAIKDVGEEEEGEEGSEELSIETNQPGLKIERNEDIDTANQIFLNILQVVKNHANALYSLAMLYQAVGEDDNAELIVNQLLSILEDDEQKESVKQQFQGLY